MTKNNEVKFKIQNLRLQNHPKNLSLSPKKIQKTIPFIYHYLSEPIDKAKHSLGSEKFEVLSESYSRSEKLLIPEIHSPIKNIGIASLEIERNLKELTFNSSARPFVVIEQDENLLNYTFNKDVQMINSLSISSLEQSTNIEDEEQRIKNS